jgi:predicted membrane protein
MKNKVKKVFWGILLLLAAAALILYGMGIGTEILEIPLYKFILSLVILAWLIAKIVGSNTLREKFKIFFPLALLFMILESEIAAWIGFPDENIVNNWFVIMAAIVANSAFNFLIPDRTKKEHSNRFSNSVHYIDVSKTTKSSVYNRMGNSEVYYQNTELADPSVELELTLSNKMGNISVYVPSDWAVVDKISNNMGNVEIREGTGDVITLVVKGENKMGNIEII